MGRSTGDPGLSRDKDPSSRSSIPSPHHICNFLFQSTIRCDDAEPSQGKTSCLLARAPGEEDPETGTATAWRCDCPGRRTGPTHDGRAADKITAVPPVPTYLRSEPLVKFQRIGWLRRCQSHERKDWGELRVHMEGRPAPAPAPCGHGHICSKDALHQPVSLPTWQSRGNPLSTSNPLVGGAALPARRAVADSRRHLRLLP